MHALPSKEFLSTHYFLINLFLRFRHQNGTSEASTHCMVVMESAKERQPANNVTNKVNKLEKLFASVSPLRLWCHANGTFFVCRRMFGPKFFCHTGVYKHSWKLCASYHPNFVNLNKVWNDARNSTILLKSHPTVSFAKKHTETLLKDYFYHIASRVRREKGKFKARRKGREWKNTGNR